jgi:hypothetical protein
MHIYKYLSLFFFLFPKVLFPSSFTYLLLFQYFFLYLPLLSCYCHQLPHTWLYFLRLLSCYFLLTICINTRVPYLNIWLTCVLFCQKWKISYRGCIFLVKNEKLGRGIFLNDRICSGGLLVVPFFLFYLFLDKNEVINWFYCH